MAIDGTPKFTTLEVREISAEITTNSVTLSGKAGFRDKNTGATHAWTKGEGAIWSKETLEQLQTLRGFMEADLARLHFSDAPGSVVAGATYSPAEPRGLMEHLVEEADQA